MSPDWRLAVLGLGLFLLIGAAPDTRRTGYEFMSPALRAIQDDELANPATLWVEDGAALWAQTCAACHGSAAAMRGVAARLPALDKQGQVVDLEAQIRLCRQRQSLTPWRWESHELLALGAFIAKQSKGMAITIVDDAKTRRIADAGARLFNQRQGQL